MLLEKTKLTDYEWQQQLAAWKSTCEQLIENFQQGDIVLNPHSAKKPCTNCELKTLCRIFETNEYERITN